MSGTSAILQSRQAARAKASAASIALALVPLLGVALSLLLGAVAPPHALIDDMAVDRSGPPGLSDPVRNTSGLHRPETTPDGVTFQWTGPRATLSFPNASFMGRHVRVDLRLASAWATEEDPVPVRVSLNGKEVAAFQITPAFQEYSLEIGTHQVPNPYLDPTHIQLDLVSATRVVPPDPRELGVMVDSVRVVAQKSRSELLAIAAAWALSLALMLVAVWRLGFTWRWVYVGGALLSLAALQLTYIPRGIPQWVEATLVGIAWALAGRLAPKRRPVWGLGLAACGLWLVLAGRLLGEWQMDDAYISYRYAWNLVQGHGLTYNPGEAVEGYTNFLWTLLAALPIALNVHPAAPALALNIALSLCLVALAWRVAARLSGGRYVWALVAAVALSVEVAVISYGARGSGMEAMLFATLLMLGATAMWHENERAVLWRGVAGGALALAALTRPEGLMVATLFLGVRLWQDRRSGKQVAKLLAMGALPFLAVVGPYQAWRIGFYGWLFPNTFYAKTGATTAVLQRGWEHFWWFWYDHGILMPLAVAGLAIGLASLFRRRNGGGILAGLALLTLAYVLYIVWAGGDHFPGWRFFVPLAAPIVLLSTEAVRRGLACLSEGTWAQRAAIAVASVAALWYVGHALWLEEPHGWLADRTRLHDSYVNRWGSAGLWLRENTPPGTWTAAKGAGAIAYYSDRPVVDVYGLNDLHIGHLDVASMGEANPGHDKQDPQYVLDRQPAYLLAEWVNYFEPVEARLEREYEYMVDRLPTGPEVAWWRRTP